MLLINVRALGAEIAKNILLSGIKSLTFLDDGTVTQEDLMTNFLLPRDSLGKNVSESLSHQTSVPVSLCIRLFDYLF